MTKFKAIYLLLLLHIAMVQFATATNTVSSVTESPLTEKGLLLIQKMGRLAGTSAYVRAISSSGDVMEIINEIAGQEFGNPSRIFAIPDLDKAIRTIPFMAELFNNVPDDMKDVIDEKMILNIPTFLTANNNGATNLAATSFLITDGAFLCSGLTTPTLYIYLYEGNYHGMVLFIPMEDNVVKAIARFVIEPEWSGLQTAEDVGRILEENSPITGLQVEVVPFANK
ncbi:histidine phosphatase family protein [Bacteroides sp. 519]|uniref:histidine phosphatase family protein n=1 Tax=Bacteroides sp. 519 TaxID=2302937 RepID=UPI0013D1F705|nr:histidine phosphatase family protein [Bacteroides sp. 519]